MSLFEGSAPPNVTTTTKTAAEAPAYLTDYLTQLAQTGQSQLGQTGADLVASPSFLQQKAYEVAPTALTSFRAPLSSALKAGEAGGAALTQQDISGFFNPYEQSVVDEMQRQSALNVQRNMLPQLRAAFGGTGAFGSQRYAGAIGQALGDVQADLLGQQAKYRAAGYQSALDAAMRQKQAQTQAAQALTGLGATEQQATTTGLKTLADLGATQQAYEQAKIEAPTVRAQNVAQLLRGYTYPTTTTQTYTGPAQVYQPSPLAQIAGLGSLVGSMFGQAVNPRTGELMQTGPGWSALSGLKNLFGSSPTGGYDPNAPLVEYTGPALTGAEYGDGGG